MRRVGRVIVVAGLAGLLIQCGRGSDEASSPAAGGASVATQKTAETQVAAQRLKRAQTRITHAQRVEAAGRAELLGLELPKLPSLSKPSLKETAMTMPMPASDKGPHYYGPYANYANSPLPMPAASVEIVGDGTGATASAMVDLVTGAVTEIQVTAPGSGYTTASVNIVGPGAGAGAQAVIGAAGTPTEGTIESITLEAGGSGYREGGIRKFMDTLPGLGEAGANNLGQYLPVAVADTTTYPGTEYYEIAVVQYREKMHTDLPPTLLRGYVQLETSKIKGKSFALTNAQLDGTEEPILGAGNAPVLAVDKPHYLGPLIIATKNKPVRILFRNLLPTGAKGNLFIPVDTTVMGAGMGPNMAGMPETDPLNPMCGMVPKPTDCYTENRATLHLHGGLSPWISDGTPHQWITPASESTPYPKGVSVRNVPDMPDPGPGAQTFFYTNQQSARLMFYHDHAWGITRLNVYAGEAAGYLITDDTEKKLVADGTLPAEQIPLVVQDKTFVPSDHQLAMQDPTWDKARWGGLGSLWVPHVYVPAQNPGDSSGVNQFGRWAYGPWFWPPTTNITYGPVPNPYYDPNCNPDLQWCEPPENPGVPHVSMGMEAFNDTPLVNGTAYPTLTVQPKAYRFRILSAANDRFFNLSLYEADASGKEVALNPAEVAAALDDPAAVFPTPVALAGPDWIQVGTEGGFLPTPVVIPAQPTTWVTDPTVFNAGNVDKHSLLLGPAERADVVVDFSQFAGKTLILYNDAPAAFPARDPRYDYYTGNPDLQDTGGAPPTIPGYGPNTRTVMQIKVADGAGAAAFDLTKLQTAFAHQLDASGKPAGVFESSQNPIIVGQSAYNQAYGKSFPNNGPQAGLVQIFNFNFTFQTLAGLQLTFELGRKAIQDEMGEAFDQEYGRMSGNLGLESPSFQQGAQNFALFPYVNPATEILKGVELPAGTLDVTPISTQTDGTQIWKITHNGVDTHPIHFHLFDVQVINRVGWDGIIRRPHPNELGWKDTVRISPLEDTIVALRPIIPKQPFGLPDSVRPLNPMMPLGSTAMFNQVDPITFGPANPPITNAIVNFGWEYVWHCHILSHEEMDMMRPLAVNVSRAKADAPVLLYARDAGGAVNLTWTDGTPADYLSPTSWGSPKNEIGFRIERALVTNNKVGAYSSIGSALANQTSFVDTTALATSVYSYRVVAFNAAGDSPSAPVVAGLWTATLPGAPTLLVSELQLGLQVYLRFQDNADNTAAETGFVMERSTVVGGVPGTFAPIATLPAKSGALGIVSFLDTTIKPATEYVYRAKAVNGGGSSAYSNTAGVTVPASPVAPSSLAVTTMTFKNKVADATLTWIDNSLDEAGFTMVASTNAGFTAGVLTRTIPANTTSFVFTGLNRGTTYYFRIRSDSLGGPSTWSNVYSATTP